jgi:adenylosuccinate synthase
VGAEYGVTTGRKRRCGWLDVPVVQYGNLLNGYSGINITKLDVLDDLDEIKIGVSYKLNGQRLSYGQMPSTLAELEAVEVEYETMKGWKTSIAHCRAFDDLPSEAQAYIKRIEELVGCPVSWIGVGVGREDMAINF